jgi:hypothetical protein
VIKHFAYAVWVSIAVAASIAQPSNDDFVARERAVWQAFKDRNADEVKKLVSTDLVAIYPDGIYNFQTRLESMSKIDMKSFSLSDFNVVRPAVDVAMISYNAKVEGNDGLSDLNCGTVWNLKNGEWKAVFHSDMKKSDR